LPLKRHLSALEMRFAQLIAPKVLLLAAPFAHADGWSFTPGGNFQHDWYRPRADVYPYVDADDAEEAQRIQRRVDILCTGPGVDQTRVRAAAALKESRPDHGQCR
jgi:hypothetical protein